MNIERIERVTKTGPQILYDAESPIAPDDAALIRNLENFLTRFLGKTEHLGGHNDSCLSAFIENVS